MALAKKDKSQVDTSESDTLLINLKTRLDMLDQRLDNMDSVVSALVERVMNQPLSVDITCSHCGRAMEITLIGNTKPGVAKDL
jgi:hypothetical protein